MDLIELLGIKPGITAVIGGGGKTTLLRTAGEELSKTSRVLLCTTTKILPFSGISCARSAEELEGLRREHSLMCGGTPLPGTEKLTAPEIPFRTLQGMFDYILVEADGAAHHPMKAHAAHEPVIPPESRQVICVVGAAGFGRPIREVVHRPELYAGLADEAVSAAVTPEIAARVLKKEALHHLIFVNQADTEREVLLAARLAACLEEPVCAGSLMRGELVKCE